jgi:RNA polymerase sigma-70 factor (ECF subfamily)
VYEAPPIDPEQHLMLRFQAGDEAAFAQLYQRIRGMVWRFSARMLGDPEAAEEAAQDILLRVFRARGSYQPTARFRTWLFRIATNHCINERQRAWRRREVGTPEGTAGLALPDHQDPASASEAAALARAIQRALAALPPQQRAAVVLARYEGCSMEQVAEALDLPSVGAAKLLLHRARRALEEQLRPFLPQEAP